MIRYYVNITGCGKICCSLRLPGRKMSKEKTGALQRREYWKYVMPGITLHR